VGPLNDSGIADSAGHAAMILCAWGAHGALRGRSAAIRALLADRLLHCLGTTRTGEPVHPLYLPYGRAPVPYSMTSPQQAHGRA